MSTDARPSVLGHATEELLEEYTFGRIREPQLGWLEEHLLICPQCQSELEDIQEYKVFMKAELASFERQRLAAAGTMALSTRPDSPLRSRAWLRKSFHFALPSMPLSTNLLAAALLLVVTGSGVVWHMRPPVTMAPLATIKLVTLRGGEGYLARAPSGHPLDLVFDRTDLPADLSYRAEVVDSSGRPMWSGNVRIADQSLSIRADRPLRAGVYWVRLYTSAGQLLREFGLSVR